MKRFVLLMFTVLFIIFSAVSVFAADTNGVTFKTEDINCDKGRILKVDVKAKSSEKISAVLLKFTYNRNIIEYRSISTDSDSLAYAYDNGSTLNVSYLCKDGKNIDNDTVILTLEFKQQPKVRVICNIQPMTALILRQKALKFRNVQAVR